VADDAEVSQPALERLVALARRRGLVVIVMTVAVAALAWIISNSRADEFTATASVLFRDPALDQKLFGSSYLPASGDASREAATNIQLLTLDDVAEKTSQRLGGSPDAAEIQDAISATEATDSDVVDVHATAATPAGAARLANTYVEQFIAFRRAADQAKVQQAQQLVQRELDSLSLQERSGPTGDSLRQRAEQLGILAALQTGNAEMVQRAAVPRHRSAPTPSKSAAIGAVLGFILGLVVAYLLERFDRRVKDVDQLTSLFSRPILGEVPQSEAYKRSAVVGGTDAEAFRIIRANLRYFDVDRRGTSSVLITSAAPGDGKSTLASNLAAAASGTGRAIVVEADLRRPTLGARFGLQPQGLTSVLAGDLSLDAAVQTVGGKEFGGGPDFDVLPSGPQPPNPAELLGTERMRALIEELKARYELVVVDAPPATVVPDALPIMHWVDGVIVVARVGKSERDALQRLRNYLANLNTHVIGIVANSTAGRDRSYYSYHSYGIEDEKVSA
jgi:capsular exopolysaccharide synthesis family protein